MKNHHLCRSRRGHRQLRIINSTIQVIIFDRLAGKFRALRIANEYHFKLSIFDVSSAHIPLQIKRVELQLSTAIALSSFAKTIDYQQSCWVIHLHWMQLLFKFPPGEYSPGFFVDIFHGTAIDHFANASHVMSLGSPIEIIFGRKIEFRILDITFARKWKLCWATFLVGPI